MRSPAERVFKGRGIEFDEVREYTPEDDIRAIDWNVTARMGTPYIKKYVEERELTVMLAVDVSASGSFGSGDKTKSQHATEIAALLAFSAIRNNDRVGLLMFSDQSELFLTPRSGRTHGLRLIRELLAFQPQRKGTNINMALETLMQVLHKKSVIFLISDLIEDDSYEKMLKIANKRHDLISVRVLDPFEIKWPRSANLILEDAEKDTVSFFSGASGKILADYAEISNQIHSESSRICKRAKVDMIDIRCGEDYVKPLMSFFRKRQKR